MESQLLVIYEKIARLARRKAESQARIILKGQIAAHYFSRKEGMSCIWTVSLKRNMNFTFSMLSKNQ